MRLSGPRRSAVAVILASLAAWIAGAGNQLAQDDRILIGQNLRLHDLGNWKAILTSPFWPPPYSEYLYRPLTSLLLALEHAAGGGSPLVFRLVSGLLAAASAAAFLVLARRLLPAGVALGVALLFAVHPVHVEAVALAVNQSELLVGLLAALMVARYVAIRRAGTGVPSLGQWSGLGLMYLLACLLKEHGLVLPALLLAAELCLLTGARPARARLVPGYLGLAAIAALFLLLRTRVLGGDVSGTFTAEAIEGLGIGGRALTMLGVVPEWFRLLLWPAHLQADYSPQEIATATFFDFPQFLGACLLLSAAVAGWVMRRSAPVVGFGLLWTAIALVPVSNLVVPSGVVLAERTLYLASAGMMLAIGGAVALLLAARGRFVPRGLPPAACGVVMALGLWRSVLRQRDWTDDERLAIRNAEDAPRSYRTQQAYGYQLFETGQRDRALEAYQRAIALAPDRHVWRVRNDLARRFFAEGRHDLAVEQLTESLALAPDRQETWNYLILAYLALGNYAEAARLSDSALARGGSPEIFGGHRALADSAARDHAPPGSIRIRVVPEPPGKPPH